MNVNTEKTKIMIFNSRNNKKIKFHICKNDLESVSELCYLGLVYTASGGFNSALKHL